MKFGKAQTALVGNCLSVRQPNHYNVILGNTVDLVTMEMIRQSSSIMLSEDQINIDDLAILNRETSWFEHGANETIRVRTINASLNCLSQHCGDSGHPQFCGYDRT